MVAEAMAVQQEMEADNEEHDPDEGGIDAEKRAGKQAGEGRLGIEAHLHRAVVEQHRAPPEQEAAERDDEGRQAEAQRDLAVEEADQHAGEDAERRGEKGAEACADEACHQHRGEGVDGADGKVELAGDHQQARAERERAEHGNSLHQDRQVLRREIAEMVGIEERAGDADDLQRHEDEENRPRGRGHDPLEDGLSLGARAGRGAFGKDGCHGLALDRWGTGTRRQGRQAPRGTISGSCRSAA